MFPYFQHNSYSPFDESELYYPRPPPAQPTIHRLAAQRAALRQQEEELKRRQAILEREYERQKQEELQRRSYAQYLRELEERDKAEHYRREQEELREQQRLRALAKSRQSELERKRQRDLLNKRQLYRENPRSAPNFQQRFDSNGSFEDSLLRQLFGIPASPEDLSESTDSLASGAEEEEVYPVMASKKKKKSKQKKKNPVASKYCNEHRNENQCEEDEDAEVISFKPFAKESKSRKSTATTSELPEAEVDTKAKPSRKVYTEEEENKAAEKVTRFLQRSVLSNKLNSLSHASKSLKRVTSDMNFLQAELETYEKNNNVPEDKRQSVYAMLEEKLIRLLTQIDTIQSDGVVEIRTERKSLAKSVNQLLERVDKLKEQRKRKSLTPEVEIQVKEELPKRFVDECTQTEFDVIIVPKKEQLSSHSATTGMEEITLPLEEASNKPSTATLAANPDESY